MTEIWIGKPKGLLYFFQRNLSLRLTKGCLEFFSFSLWTLNHLIFAITLCIFFLNQIHSVTQCINTFCIFFSVLWYSNLRTIGSHRQVNDIMQDLTQTLHSSVVINNSGRIHSSKTHNKHLGMSLFMPNATYSTLNAIDNPLLFVPHIIFLAGIHSRFSKASFVLYYWWL